jgi:hypothetical protein
MLRSYFWSLTLVVLVLGVYTAVVLHNRKSPDVREPRLEAARTSSSQDAETAAATIP